MMSSKKLQRIKRLEKRIPQKPLTDDDQLILLAWIKMKEFSARTQPELPELPDEPPPEEWERLRELQREALAKLEHLQEEEQDEHEAYCHLLPEGSGSALAAAENIENP